LVHQRGLESTDGAIAEVLVDESSDALIGLSPTGTILFWSLGAERIYQYSRQAALGRPLDELIVPPDRRAEATAALARVVASGAAVAETVRLRADGIHLAVDVTMRAIYSPDGQLRFIAVTEADVSTQNRLRAARSAEARFSGLLEAAPDAMVIVGEGGRIVLVNGQAERLFGYDRDELYGQPVEILVPDG
jgi:protein-histidine pros-kinase